MYFNDIWLYSQYLLSEQYYITDLFTQMQYAYIKLDDDDDWCFTATFWYMVG